MQHCGICSVLADLFRRLMCIGGSRRGSDDSYYQELEEDEARRGAISVDRTDQNAIFISMVGPMVATSRTRQLSDSDWLLLETLDTRCQRPLHTGRFLTMHKRRRKRLTTRSLTQEPALLDDIHHGQVQCVLNRVWQWPFNAFTLDTVTGGRSLPVLCVHLFHWYGLMDHFNLDVVRVWKLFTLVEEGYHSTNPYHNSIHATDVTQAMHCFLQEEKIRKYLTPLEIMSSLIAAVTHDLDHPGVNQPFLIATSNHLAALYEAMLLLCVLAGLLSPATSFKSTCRIITYCNQTLQNTSVLENHHWRSAIGCLLESNVAEQLGMCRQELERQISSLILATDITRQQEFLTRFKRYLDQSLLDLRRAEDRHFILQIALKCADISNPCRPWDVSRKWSQKVCEEFFRQGDYERQLNLPVTSLCDRQSTSVPKIQAGFFRFVVSPLFEEWHRFLGTNLSDLMMGYLRSNQSRWEALVQQELAEETRTEISEAEVLDEVEIEDSSEDEPIDEMTGSIEMLLPESPCIRRPSLPCRTEDADPNQRVGRRHSVPLSMPRPTPITRTIIRRESLPVGEHKTQRRYPSGPILHLEEEEELHLAQSSLSLLSSCSSGLQHSSGGGSGQDKRPVSAENLLPEPSIASITTSLEASRLSSVLHGGNGPPGSISASLGPSRFLTRQQTFPPLQPYIRVRYMSTTAEMSSCSEALAEAGSQSVSSSSSRTDLLSNATLSRQVSEQATDLPGSPSDSQYSRNGCGTPANKARALRDNNRTSPGVSECGVESGRDIAVTLPSTGNKREQTDPVETSREKGSKMAKLSESSMLQQMTLSWEKENVDPRSIGSDVELDVGSNKSSTLRRNTTQGLARRRGSAPVGLLNRSDDSAGPTALALRGGGERFLRRGSVPIDVTRQSVLRPLGFRENSVCPPPPGMPRRSSLPFDTNILSSLLDPLTVPTGNREGAETCHDDVCSRGLDSQGTTSIRLTEDSFPPNSNQQYYLTIRRGSAPTEFGSELRRLDGNGGSRNGNNGKSRSRKKILRRRSSGGPEMFCTPGPEVGGDSIAWQRWRRDILARRTACESLESNQDQLLARRRASLPIDALPATLVRSRHMHAGEHQRGEEGARSWTSPENLS